MTTNQKGAIVVVSSMSSQIYNQAGLCKPLEHVGGTLDFIKGLTLSFQSGIL